MATPNITVSGSRRSTSLTDDWSVLVLNERRTEGQRQCVRTTGKEDARLRFPATASPWPRASKAVHRRYAGERSHQAIRRISSASSIWTIRSSRLVSIRLSTRLFDGCSEVSVLGRRVEKRRALS